MGSFAVPSPKINKFKCKKSITVAENQGAAAQKTKNGRRGGRRRNTQDYTTLSVPNTLTVPVLYTPMKVTGGEHLTVDR